jgi:hypothetical protein
VKPLVRGAALLVLIAATQGVGADANLEGHWRWWDQPGRGERFIARTPSLIFADSFLLVYFDARKNCAPFLALAFEPANPQDRPPAEYALGQQLEVRVDDAEPVRFLTAVSARAGNQHYVVHPLSPNLLEAISAGTRLLARAAFAPQTDLFSLRGSAVSLRRQRALCRDHHRKQTRNAP